MPQNLKTFSSAGIFRSNTPRNKRRQMPWLPSYQAPLSPEILYLPNVCPAALTPGIPRNLSAS
jgi:hypothetical protein